MLSLADRIDPKQTALLVIDVQNDFCHPEGVGVRSFGSGALADIQAAIKNIYALIGGAREAGVFIAFLRSTFNQEYVSAVMRDQQERRGTANLCQKDTWGSEFHAGIIPDPKRGEQVLLKHQFSAFAETALDSALRSHHITRVICCGFTTSVCVESTARDAFSRNYYCIIAEDAVAEFDSNLHHSTLKVFDRIFGLVLPVRTILETWRSPIITNSGNQ
jgi:ureidoacrylate peracid hydrolase